MALLVGELRTMCNLQKRRFFKTRVKRWVWHWGSDGGKHLGHGRVGCGADRMVTSLGTMIFRNINFHRKCWQPHGTPVATSDNLLSKTATRWHTTQRRLRSSDTPTASLQAFRQCLWDASILSTRHAFAALRSCRWSQHVGSFEDRCLPSLSSRRN